jgi:DHA1 family multidrug resistance protein-like MFS transporter
MIFNGIKPIQPLFMVEVGATEIEVGLIFAFSSIISLLIRIPMGAITDRIGRRTMIMITLFFQFITTTLFFFVYDVVWFYFLITLQAMSTPLFNPAAISLVSDDASSETIGRIMGIYYTFMGFGRLVGPIFSGVLTEYIAFRQVFLVISILPIFGLLATTRWKDDHNRDTSLQTQEASKDTPMRTSFTRILQTRNVIGICLSRITWAIATAVLYTIFPIWAKKDLFITTSMISLLFSIMGAMDSFTRMPIGMIASKIGFKKLLILSYCLAGFAFFIFSVTNVYHIFIIAMLIFGFAWGIAIVSDGLILTVSVESRDKSFAIAIGGALFTLGNSVGSFMSGVTYNILSMSAIFQIASGMLFVGMCTLILLIKEKQFIIYVRSSG